MVEVSPEVYKLVRLVVHLARCLYAECGGGYQEVNLITQKANLTEGTVWLYYYSNYEYV